ncbi:MAG: C10 family peptidase, partial [Muribaculaceae bacterium]|nr:C10 family peptidase [Muribaculaceae bacterium]
VLGSDVEVKPITPNTRTDREMIAPLLSTRWDQGSPYNLDCPLDGSKRSVTGCLATAMAQVIAFYGYPSVGSGSHSYEWKDLILDFDYGQTHFDFDNMLNSYSGRPSTQNQKKAVAKLMYACGVSVDMNYGAKESGARYLFIANALKEYFCYDAGVSYLLRNYYSKDEWEKIVYEELLAERPVIYGGQSPEGGHAFVCDGYDEGLFHINWGWGGYCDGWYLLSALNPEGQGTGGHEGGYNSAQNMIIGIQPNIDGTPSQYPLYASSGLVVSDIIRNSYLTIEFLDGGGVFNYSPLYFNSECYLMAVSQDGKELISDNGINCEFPGFHDDSSWGFIRLRLPLPYLEEGNYKVYVLFSGPDGQRYPLRIPYGYKPYIGLKVDASGKVTASDDDLNDPEYVTKLEVSQETDVYTADGILLRHRADATYISSLAPGLYIIRTSVGTVRMLKR